MTLNKLPQKEELEAWSYRTSLKRSLRSPINKFLVEELLEDINLYRRKLKVEDIPYDYRIKSIHSAKLKITRYSNSKDVRSIFNDILGIRIIVSEYENLKIPEYYRVVDMREGKSDGYKGIHLYYQMNNEYYPIEIQINSIKDRNFNDWMHKYLYKKVDSEVCKKIREKYDNQEISTEKDFIKECDKYEIYCSKGF